MTGILKVDQWKDSGDNTLMTSDGAGNLTVNTPLKTSGNMTLDSEGNISLSALTDITYQNTSTNSTAGHHIFKTYNTEIMRIDGGTNSVGIGTSSPTSGGGLTLSSSTTGQGFIDFKHTVDGDSGYIGNSKALITGATTNQLGVRGGTNGIAFSVGATERMRIVSDGTIQLATSQGISNYKTNPGNWVSNITDGAEDFRVGTLVTSADASVIHIVNKTATGSGNFMAFRIQGSTKGTISTDGSNTSYNSVSDYRLKENVVDVVDAITRVKQLQPKRFNFIEQPNKTVDGFLAHEVSEVVPEAITGTKDEIETYTDLEGNEQTRPVYQNIDQSKLVPLLTASLKEAIAKIEELETRIATLENA